LLDKRTIRHNNNTGIVGNGVLSSVRAKWLFKKGPSELENIFDGLVSHGFDVVSAKQMTANRRSPPEDRKGPGNFPSL
jgi:hypothetical protein